WAFRRRGLLEVLVDVVEADAAGDHHDLHVVEQLGDLLRGGLVRLVLGCHPDLGGLFHDLLADGMDARVEGGDGSRALRASECFLGEFGVELLEGLHGREFYVPSRWVATPIRAGTAQRDGREARSGAAGSGLREGSRWWTLIWS